MEEWEQTEFDKLAQGYGGRWAVDPFDNSLEVFRRLEACFNHEMADLRSSQRTRKRRVLFSFLRDSRLNAVASHSYGTYFIGMNFGAILQIVDLCSALLCDRQVLRHIGIPDVEIVQYADLSDGIGGTQLLHPLEGYPGRFNLRAPRYTPVDDQRARFSYLLTMLAVEYMFRHEVAHTICGHANHANSLRCTLTAVGPNTATTPHYRDLQAMEMDADFFAFAILDTLVERGDTVLLSLREQGWTTEQLLEAWAIATAIYFRLLDQTQDPLEAFDGTSHPHPDVRYLACVERTSDALAANSRLKASWREIHKQSVLELGDAWTRLRIPGSFYASWTNDTTGLTQRYEEIALDVPRIRDVVAKWDLRQE